MKDTIKNLEKAFFEYVYTSDEDWLDQTLSDSFKECGKSGYVSDKRKTMDDLLSLRENREIVIYNFECEAITEDSWIVHYITKTEQEEMIFRTSIWVLDGNVKLFFHQASLLKEQVQLVQS